jgi:hypothetical protein
VMSRKTVLGVIFVLLVCAAGGIVYCQEAPAPTAAEKYQKLLDEARNLYTEGRYDECRAIVSDFLREYEAGNRKDVFYTVTSGMYAVDALLAYAFREDGYEATIDRQLLRALEIDLTMSLGDPAEIPPFVMNRFNKVKTEYLAQFLRTTRRWGVGLFGALVLEPTVLLNPLLLQPGLALSYNLTENLTVTADFRFPLQWPVWNSIRGQVGVVWFPTFSIETIIATGVSFSYTFGLDNLTTFTHSLSFGGRAELLTRSGFGIVGNAELVRADLIMGGTATTPAKFSEIPLLGLLNIVFSNITIYVYYVF